MSPDEAHSLIARYLVRPEQRRQLIRNSELDPNTAVCLDRFAALIARVRHNQLRTHFPQTIALLESSGMLAELFLDYEPTFQRRRGVGPRNSVSQFEDFRLAIQNFARRRTRRLFADLVDFANHECALATVRCEDEDIPAPPDFFWCRRIKVAALTANFIESRTRSGSSLFRPLRINASAL